jgi:hypothetical protein
MDPRIRIHTKMSWIRNTATNRIAPDPSESTIQKSEVKKFFFVLVDLKSIKTDDLLRYRYLRIFQWPHKLQVGSVPDLPDVPICWSGSIKNIYGSGRVGRVA